MRERDVQTASLFSVEILHGAGQHPISLKKARVCVACVFSRPQRELSGAIVSCRVFGILSKLRLIARSDSLDEEESRAAAETAPGHRFTSPCPLAGLVKSKNNTAHASRCKWTRRCKSDVLRSSELEIQCLA